LAASEGFRRPQEPIPSSRSSIKERYSRSLARCLQLPIRIPIPSPEKKNRRALVNMILPFRAAAFSPPLCLSRPANSIVFITPHFDISLANIPVCATRVPAKRDGPPARGGPWRDCPCRGALWTTPAQPSLSRSWRGISFPGLLATDAVAGSGQGGWSQWPEGAVGERFESYSRSERTPMDKSNLDPSAGWSTSSGGAGRPDL
jgi:hypothetical protein